MIVLATQQDHVLPTLSKFDSIAALSIQILSTHENILDEGDTLVPVSHETLCNIVIYLGDSGHTYILLVPIHDYVLAYLLGFYFVR